MEVVKASRLQKTGKHDWAVLSVTTHQTEAVGNVDGYRIFLQPAQLEANDAVASTDQRHPTFREGIDDATEEATHAMEVDTEASQSRPSRSGFQRFVCLQFVDGIQT
jgi:hypothetical protein